MVILAAAGWVVRAGQYPLAVSHQALRTCFCVVGTRMESNPQFFQLFCKHASLSMSLMEPSSLMKMFWEEAKEVKVQVGRVLQNESAHEVY